MNNKSKSMIEFGDFQTPTSLAMQVVCLIRQQLKIEPNTIIEPTCGKGNILLAAMLVFPNAQKYLGVDINPVHLTDLQTQLINNDDPPLEIIQGDFFTLDWQSILADTSEPILILGNPPWVTNAQLGTLQSLNLPKKSNFQAKKGLEAITGKSNFDISEWIIQQNVAWLRNKIGAIAMLCKTKVARKLLISIWKNKIPISSTKIFKIDAKKYFNVAVNSCLFMLESDGINTCQTCDVFNDISDTNHVMTLGYANGALIADVKTYHELSHLAGQDQYYQWRSGVKHDCAKVMELTLKDDMFINGYNISVTLENDFIYPLFKGSDVYHQRENQARFVIIPQKFIGEDTHKIQILAPKTWAYLNNNRQAFEQRSSTIYKNQPSFAIFGVGDYTFAPYKVAISSFYKQLKFVVIEPIQQKPVIFDDTVYFLACQSLEEAVFIADLLNSTLAQSFLLSMIFWEDKRPITIDLLKRLNLQALAQALGCEETYLNLVKHKGMLHYQTQSTQLSLFTQ